MNLLLGSSVAFSAHLQIRTMQRPVSYNRYFNALMLLEALVVVPAGIYFAAFYPDWSWMYLVDARSLPTGTSVMAIASYPVAAGLGYLVGYFSARSASDWVTVIFMLFVVLSLGGRFAGAEFEFPRLIVEVVRAAEAEVGGEGQVERVAGGEVPGAHERIVADWGEVEGYNLVW